MSFVYQTLKRMKVLFLILAIMPVISAAQVHTEMPDWLIHKIQTYQISHPYIGAQLTEYEGRVAWYIPPRCCDIPGELYDGSGNLICHPDGALAGADGKCPAFR
jgi:hypothetical protein